MNTRVVRRGEQGAPANVFKLRRFGVELRAAASDDAPEGVLEGYATVYDVGYGIGWGITEQIAPACFDLSIAEQNGIIPIFYMHDWDNPIGHATVTSDAKGVRVVATLYIEVNERAMSVWLAAKAGALREWSIGFYPQVIEISVDADGDDLETITQADLAEASIVVRGANPETEMIDVRSMVTVTEEEAAEAQRLLDEAAAEAQRALDEAETQRLLDEETQRLLDEEDAERRDRLAEYVDRPWVRDELRLIHKAV